MRTGAKPSRPEWAVRLERMRERLGLSQAALARRLHVSAMATSRWERGVNQPPAEILIQLGKMAKGATRWYFWQLAGLKRRDLDTKVEPANPGQVAVRLCKDPAAIGGRTTATVMAPREWCPNPDRTVCFSIADDKMAPWMRSGSVVAVDLTENRADALAGKLVLATHPQEGFRVHWLEHLGNARMLVPENKKYAPIYLADHWTILGRVVWWLAKAP